jgi:phage protein D
MANAHSFEITVAGATLSQADPQGLASLVVEDHVDKLAVATLTIETGGIPWSKFVIGDEVTIKIGAGERPFTGLITELRHCARQGHQSLIITALDPLVLLASSRHTRVFEELTDSDIASSVMSDCSKLSVGNVESTSEKRAYIFQRNESDLVFLKRLASRNGFVLRAEDGEALFETPSVGGSPLEISFDGIQLLDYTMCNQKIPTSLTVYGWDYVAKESVEGSASGSDISTIGSGKNAVDESGRIWTEEAYISDVLVQSQSAAKDMAVGELSRLARSFLRGRTVMEARGDIYAGSTIKFSGFGTGFNPEAFVVSVRHALNTSGGNSTEVRFVSNTVPE